MVPTITSRLRSMMRAMQEVVMPALDSQNAIALEQGQLVLGSLNLLLGQVDYAHTFEVIEARELSALLAEIAALGDREPATAAVPITVQAFLDQCRSLVENAATPVDVLQVLNRDLREQLSRLIEAIECKGSRGLVSAVEMRVTEFSAAHLARERSWVAATGFEAPGSAADIPTALGIDRRSNHGHVHEGDEPEAHQHQGQKYQGQKH